MLPLHPLPAAYVGCLCRLCQGNYTALGGTDRIITDANTNKTFIVYSAGAQRSDWSFFDPTQCQVDPTTLYANFILNGNRASIVQTVFNFWRDGTALRVGTSYVQELQYVLNGRLPRDGIGQRFYKFGRPALNQVWFGLVLSVVYSEGCTGTNACQ